jgi:CheY-like chemotaxis protein
MTDPNASLATCNVLVCEYKQINQRVIERILLHYGYSVLMTSSTDEALELFWEHPELFNLLLIDIPVARQVDLENNKLVMRLPEISFEWLERIRQGFPNLPVLLISASLGETFVPPANARHLPKPFTSQDLFSMVSELLLAAAPSTTLAEAA